MFIMRFLPDLNKFVKNTTASPKENIHSLELVLTIVIFVLLGRFIDSKADTAFTFTIIFLVIGVCGAFASAYYRYIAISKSQDKDKAYTRQTKKTTLKIEEEEKDELIVPKGYGQDDK